MPESPLSVVRILDAAQVVLRRHGVEKTNVVDIARVLGVSHANIYRHFPSKKALLDAVATRWLAAVTFPLEAIASDQTRSATARLTAWFTTLRTVKQRKVLDDPELFRVYHRLAMGARELAHAHVESLLGQVERIISDGIKRGEFSKRLKAPAAARACLHAMSSFHHPAMLSQEEQPKEEDARAVLGLLLAGLRSGSAPLPRGKH